MTLADASQLSLVVLAALLVLGALWRAISYHNRPFRIGEKPISGRGYRLSFVEIDDRGWLWDQDQYRQMMRCAEESARDADTLLIVFVHGWHHNAREGDSNVGQFQEVLQGLADLLDQPDYRKARAEMGIDPEPPGIEGIYVGWRGRSLPGLLDYLTFWGRKAVAETVGDQDLRVLLLELHDLYVRRNEGDRFVGFVTVGHSFGGQAVLRSTVQLVEEKLIAHRGSGETADVADRVVSGLGDLTILVNPAVEAAAFRRIHALVRGDMRFSPEQTPVLLVVSSDTDLARRSLFPLGRRIGEFFKARLAANQKQVEREALGVFPRHVTHRLCPAAPGTVETWPDTELAGRGRCRADPLSRCAPIPYSPVLVAQTTNEIVTGHNGIFTKPFQEFATHCTAIRPGERGGLQ